MLCLKGILPNKSTASVLSANFRYVIKLFTFSAILAFGIDFVALRKTHSRLREYYSQGGQLEPC